MMRQMDVWRIPAVGGDPKRVTNHRNWVVSPTRSTRPDPSLLGSGRGRFRSLALRGRCRAGVPHHINLGFEQYTSISATADGPAPRRDCNQFYRPSLENSDPGIHPAQESEASQVVDLPNVRAVGPRHGPDYFLYLSSRGGPEGLWKFKSREAFELWKGSENGQISSPAISSDGKKVAFALEGKAAGHSTG